jgi:hypothetical protein
VEGLSKALRASGIDAWYSGWEISPGDSIPRKVDEGLQGCDYFIIVISKDSLTRPWVRAELDAATARKNSGRIRKIIPIKIEECDDIPPILGSLCWKDFSNQPHESAFKRIIDSIFELSEKPLIGSRPSPETSKATGSRRFELQPPAVSAREQIAQPIGELPWVGGLELPPRTQTIRLTDPESVRRFLTTVFSATVEDICAATRLPNEPVLGALDMLLRNHEVCIWFDGKWMRCEHDPRRHVDEDY